MYFVLFIIKTKKTIIVEIKFGYLYDTILVVMIEQ